MVFEMDGIGMCEVCGELEECIEECNCEDCIQSRAEAYYEGLMDTYGD